MAKYEQYAEYKDSGVEWLGVIPSHWKIQPLKHQLIFMKNGSTATQVEEKKATVPISRIETISSGEIDMSRVGFVDTKTIPQSFMLDKGDVLFSHINSLSMIGNLAIKRNNEKLFHGMNLLRLKLDSSKAVIDYMFWLLKSKNLRQVIEANAKPAINQASISTQSLKNIYLNIPTEKEQAQIANFLDHETAQIDTLINKQQTLIQLLKEKRQAVISHAVTKGLNPDAPMKDSGVEWLGEVPEHWEVKRFKFLCDQIISGPFGSSITKDMYVKYGYKVYGQEQVIANNFEIGDYFISAKDFKSLSRYKVEKGSILISCVGTFGKIAVFPFDAVEGIINPRLIQAKLSSGNDSFFIRELLKSETVYKQFELLSRGGTMGVINISILNEIIIATPNKIEQTEIYEYLIKQQNSFNSLIERAEQAIQLMQERRTALISAAVTGKIDVRGWRASEAS